MAHMQTLGAMSPDGDFIVWLVVGLIGVGVGYVFLDECEMAFAKIFAGTYTGSAISTLHVVPHPMVAYLGLHIVLAVSIIVYFFTRRPPREPWG
jgi:hypothetical protein